jgi:hypothetical protein
VDWQPAIVTAIRATNSSVKRIVRPYILVFLSVNRYVLKSFKGSDASTMRVVVSVSSCQRLVGHVRNCEPAWWFGTGPAKSLPKLSDLASYDRSAPT